jgi:17beta-estradiol 17-dehydrogenase / very-long-chain 3-oxoacyl-CoA reductase
MGLFCCLGSLKTFLKFVGFLKFLELFYRFIWWIMRQLRTTAHLTERYGKGSWALVTGGSDGIGLAICKELARRDFNIVIVSRRMEQMRQAEAQIKAIKPQC